MPWWVLRGRAAQAGGAGRREALAACPEPGLLGSCRNRVEQEEAGSWCHPGHGGGKHFPPHQGVGPAWSRASVSPPAAQARGERRVPHCTPQQGGDGRGPFCSPPAASSRFLCFLPEPFLAHGWLWLCLCTCRGRKLVPDGTSRRARFSAPKLCNELCLASGRSLAGHSGAPGYLTPSMLFPCPTGPLRTPWICMLCLVRSFAWLGSTVILPWLGGGLCVGRAMGSLEHPGAGRQLWEAGVSLRFCPRG